jgi:hypothetical protein
MAKIKEVDYSVKICPPRSNVGGTKRNKNVKMKTWPLKFSSGNLEHRLVDIEGKVLSKAFILHIKISRRARLTSLTLISWVHVSLAVSLTEEHNI